MAFPFLEEGNFENGAKWTDGTSSDSASRIKFPHFSTLAKVPNLPAPYRGAFCMSINLAGSTTTAYILENTSFDMAAAETQFFRFQFFISSDFVMANTNEFQIFVLRSASAYEVAVVVNFTTANGLRIGVGESAGAQFQKLTPGEWHTVELSILLDDGTVTGTIDWWLDGSPGTQVGTLTQAAVTNGRIGVMGQDAGTTKGVVLFDEIYSDDARLYPIKDRFSQTLMMTSSGHAFVGPGVIENITLISSAGTDCVVSVYDTDTADTNDMENRVVLLRNTAAGELVDPAGMPGRVTRGAYVAISSGTIDAEGPFALLKLGQVKAFGSDGAVRTMGSRRKGEVLAANNTSP